MEVTVLKGNIKKVFTAKEGDNLLVLLAGNGYFITASCGGKGTCGKCKVKLLNGSIHNTAPDNNGYILSCRAKIAGDLTIEVPDVEGGGLLHSYTEAGYKDEAIGYGLAVDIGTTTLAFYLMDLKSGKEVDNYSCLNPQGVFGADVISRISACAKGHLNELNKLITNKAKETGDYLLNKHGINKFEKMTICGNTTMMHLFAGFDAAPLGVYPFTPAFLKKKEYTGKDSTYYKADRVILLPSISSYVGSDITAGIVSAGLAKDGKNKILIDIGTNGEIALFSKGRLYCASTAAGPAFEGANMTCGMGGVEGAVDSVNYSGGKLIYTVIKNGVPKGICGSALVDIISIMLENGIIDETGAFAVLPENSSLKQYIKDDKFYIVEDIFISQKDVREYQLAKSAICSGIKAIVNSAGITLRDIDKILIAGGLGFYIKQKNAVRTGLIPFELRDKIQIVGNSAGAGAKLCLLSSKYIEECEKAAAECKNIELSTDSYFMDEYINNMDFELK